MKSKEKIRMCAVSNLRKGTHFSFKKKGTVFVAGDRFMVPGKSDYEMSLHYFGLIKGRYFHGHLKYKLTNALMRLVYLHDLNNLKSTQIPKIKVIYR